MLSSSARSASRAVGCDAGIRLDFRGEAGLCWIEVGVFRTEAELEEGRYEVSREAAIFGGEAFFCADEGALRIDAGLFDTRTGPF